MGFSQVPPLPSPLSKNWSFPTFVASQSLFTLKLSKDPLKNKQAFKRF